MNMTRCTADDICVRTLDGFGRRFGRGAFADLDEIVGATSAGEPLSLGDALGRHVSAFEPVDDQGVALPSPPMIDISDDGNED